MKKLYLALFLLIGTLSTLAQNCNLTASFTSAPAPNNPREIHFTNTSTGTANTDSIRWNFGDGSTSNIFNPTHVYSDTGHYNVCLHIYHCTDNGAVTTCVGESCHIIHVEGPAATACNLVASFTSAPAPNNPREIHFTNTSTGTANTDSIRWNFGDGSTSNVFNPTHIYSDTGHYNVCLHIYHRTDNGAVTTCVGESCHIIHVEGPAATACNLVASFTSAPAPNNPREIHFTNTSTGTANTDSIRWNFGDGSTSNVFNPTHVYSDTGHYNVCLHIYHRTDNGAVTTCIGESCHTIHVEGPAATACNLVASFTSAPAPNNPREIHFTNTSTGTANTDSIRWNFGDGSTSNIFNPTHVYSDTGHYNVCLHIYHRTDNGAVTTCVGESCHIIHVEGPAATACNLVASFTSAPAPNNPREIHFTNTSTGTANTDSIRWNFGDGSTSNVFNPTHVYSDTGHYNVCLHIYHRTDNGTVTTCVGESCHTIHVEGPAATACNLVPTFIAHPAAINPREIIFTNTTVVSAAATSASWSFGDGGSATTWHANHTYDHPGRYKVCLTVHYNNCTVTHCDSVTVAPPINCANIITNFYDHRESLNPNLVTFTVISNAIPVDETWTIRNLSTGSIITLHANNPSYLFTDTGSYRICLRAVYPQNCVKEVCKEMHISTAMPGVTACAMQVYPNPATATIHAVINLTTPTTIHAYLYNSMGILLQSKEVSGIPGSNVISFGVGNLPSGVYTIRLQYEGHNCSENFYKN